MNPLIIYFLTVSSFSYVADRDGYTITGYTSNIADSTIIYLRDRTEDIDSTYIIGNSFSFKGRLNEPYKNLWIHTKNFSDYRSLWVENTNMTIDARSSTLRKAKVTGSGIQEQSNEYEAWVSIYNDEMDSLRKIARTLTPADSIRKQELRESFRLLGIKRNQRGIEFVREHPSYELSAFFLTFLKNKIAKDETKKLYDSFDRKVQNTEWGKTIALFLEKSVKLEPGDKAVDFILPDLNGREVSLFSFKGKYVLLEFWATGCGPCRMENPNLLKAYRRYKTDGFEILGVSLDESRKSWESTVEKDSIVWTTVCDLKGISGIVPVTYSVYYIPNNYLIDPEGTVIAKDLRGEKLQEKLKELFERSQ